MLTGYMCICKTLSANKFMAADLTNGPQDTESHGVSHDSHVPSLNFCTTCLYVYRGKVYPCLLFLFPLRFFVSP